MALLLGIDTGGTFTDAVVVDDIAADQGRTGPAPIVAAAKVPTTHGDLAVGIAAAIGGVVSRLGPEQADGIELVSVSTTLATNALVEGHGEPAGLIAFGFSRRELERGGIGAAVDPDLVALLAGGHDAHGEANAEPDVAAIEAAASHLADSVTAFAVAAQFSVRNPAHEILAADVIRQVTGLPVTPSHRLSARLDGPRRAVTAVLNARLIGVIGRLNRAVDVALELAGIDAPVMVVRGDGSLVTAAFAADRPIETILSGPAASVVGALHLAAGRSGVSSTVAMVADIGGTTTDLAVVVDGRPTVSDRGAEIGGHRTMVEAIEVATTGLGGDSEIRIDDRKSRGPIVLGPERAVPMCRLALDHPEIHDVLDRQLRAPLALTAHGRFLVAVADHGRPIRDRRERELLDRLHDGPKPFADAAPTGLAAQAARRLRRRGLVRLATMTPTDASAVLGRLDDVDIAAAGKVAELLARRTLGTGRPLAAGGDELSRRVIDHLVVASARFALRTGLAVDGVTVESGNELLEATLRRHHRTVATSLSLTGPLLAIGAAAAAYYPAVGEAAGTTAVIPAHAEVANALGAVIGRVRTRGSITITQPTRGQFRVHVRGQPSFGSVDSARDHAASVLEAQVRAEAVAAGAGSVELTTTWTDRTAVVHDKEVFVEGVLTIHATGRPRFAPGPIAG